MDDTQWDQYGTGRYEKCGNCMVHCGYEPTAAEDALAHPLKTMLTALRGPRTEGPMAEELDMSNVRPAEYVFSNHVEKALEEIRSGNSRMIAEEEDAPSACCCGGGGCCGK
jgi:hypothetical protein